MTRPDPDAGRSPPQKEKGEEKTGVTGERGATVVNSIRSMQSRVSSFLAAGVMIALGLGALSWYYANALGRQKRLRQSAVTTAANNAQAEMSLPPLGAVEPPRLGILTRAAMTYGPDSQGVMGAGGMPGATAPMKGNRGAPVPTSMMPGAALPAAPEPVSGALRVAPEVPMAREHQSWSASPGAVFPYTGDIPPYSGTASPHSLPRQSVSDRRLSGVTFVRDSAEPPVPPAVGGRVDEAAAALAGGIPTYRAVAGLRAEDGSTRNEEGLGKLLRPRVTTPAQAQIVPTQQFLLPKGAFIDCTLETAIDSTLPGMTTCVTATDTFGIDGKVVLLERGSKLVGETRGEVQNGAARIFVLWNEARTPTGVVVPLESPGTDELGRSGLPGEVNRHFWDRFGAAMLISVIDGAVQAAVQSSTRGGGAIIYNPAASQEALTDVLKGTVNIAPTVSKRNGDRIQILVARDLDFRAVYELHTSF
jgi:type IV secretion system protein VirB10